ncbi:MAG: hypothetical protein ACREBU_15435 [Nitrososphaera sp.]
MGKQHHYLRRMVHCPKCDGQVIQCVVRNLIGQVDEWMCLRCGGRYNIDALKKAILTV